jgi:hypothetical protein
MCWTLAGKSFKEWNHLLPQRIDPKNRLSLARQFPLGHQLLFVQFHTAGVAFMIRTSNFGENPLELCYIYFMDKRILSQTNPYLRDKARRTAGLLITVCSSSAIEGIAAENFINEYLTKKAATPKPVESAKIAK